MIKHNIEIKQLQDSNSEALKILSDERKKFSEESFTLLKNERDRINKIHKQELVSLEKQYESDAKQQQIISEHQLTFYKKQIKKQNELTKLSDNFQISVLQLDDVTTKIDREKTLEEKTKIESLEARERILNEM